MALTYATWQAEVAKLLVTQPTDANFVAIMPGMIDYAEQRIYRDLDLLSTVVSDASGSFTALRRTFALPTASNFVVVAEANVITPAGASTTSGARTPLEFVSRAFLDACYGSASSTLAGVPKYAAMLDNQTLIVGPWPDQAYAVEIVGTTRPAPLSSSNTTTFLTTYLPDLFIAASMVFGTGYQRNFGAQADDPKMAMSWEQQYGALKASAEGEEIRKKFAGMPMPGAPAAAG